MYNWTYVNGTLTVEMPFQTEKQQAKLLAKAN